MAQTREAKTTKIREEDAEESRQRRKRNLDLVIGGADGDEPNAESPTIPTPRLAGELVGLARRAHDSFAMKSASLSHILHGSQSSPVPRGSTDSAHSGADEKAPEPDEAEARVSAPDAPRGPTDEDGRLLSVQSPGSAMRRNTPILAPLNDDRRRGSAQAGPSDDPIARRGPVPAIDGDAAKPNGVSSASNDASSPPVTPPRTANQPPSATEGTQLLDDSPRAGPGGLEATVLSTRLDALDAAQRETAQRLDANTSILLSIMARLDQLAPPAETATREGRESYVS